MRHYFVLLIVTINYLDLWSVNISIQSHVKLHFRHQNGYLIWLSVYYRSGVRWMFYHIIRIITCNVYFSYFEKKKLYFSILWKANSLFALLFVWYNVTVYGFAYVLLLQLYYIQKEVDKQTQHAFKKNIYIYFFHYY